MADIEELINTVADQDFSKAGPLFKDVLKTKIDAAMEQEKIRLAGSIYNDKEIEPEITNEPEITDEPGTVTNSDLQVSSEEDSDEEDDVSDEEIEAAIDELEDEEDKSDN